MKSSACGRLHGSGRSILHHASWSVDVQLWILLALWDLDSCMRDRAAGRSLGADLALACLGEQPSVHTELEDGVRSLQGMKKIFGYGDVHLHCFYMVDNHCTKWFGAANLLTPIVCTQRELPHGHSHHSQGWASTVSSVHGLYGSMARWLGASCAATRCECMFPPRRSVELESSLCTALSKRPAAIRCVFPLWRTRTVAICDCLVKMPIVRGCSWTVANSIILAKQRFWSKIFKKCNLW
jgi:hypothetical protein